MSSQLLVWWFGLPHVLRGLDRKIEFGLPDLEGRTHIFKIHAKILC